jgi:signal peptidase II
MARSNSVAFWAAVAGITGADVFTKWWVESSLLPQRVPHTLVENWLRITLVYNPGAAFGLEVGPESRWVFMGLTLLALAILGRMYLNTRDGDIWRAVALGLVCGGALGNLIDRVRSGQGVVDFIDIGFGNARWPTFNVADMAVSTGAVLLACVLWWADGRESEPAIGPASLSVEQQP